MSEYQGMINCCCSKACKSKFEANLSQYAK